MLLDRPETIGQAARLPGITPAAISLLLVHLKKLRRGDLPAANDGGTAFHYHDHAGTRTPDDITANLDAFARAIKKAHRAGKLGFALPSN